MTIRRRVLLVYLLTLVPLAGLAIALLFGWFGAQRQTIAEGRLNNARLVATAFRTTIDDIEATSFVVGESVLASPVGEAAAGEEPTTAAGAPHPSLQRLVASFPLHYALVLDEDAIVFQSSDEDLLGRAIEDTAVAEVLGGEESAIGVSRELLGKTGFVLAQRIGGVEGPTGVGVQFVDPERLSARLAQNPIGGGAHVVDSSGRLVAIFEFPQLAAQRPYWGQHQVVRSALGGSEHVDFNWTFPPTGTRRVGAAVPLTDIGWEAGSAVDYEAAFAPFQRSLATTILVAAFVVVFSALAVRATALRLIESVEALCHQSEAVGRLDREPAEILHTGDELEEVSRALDRADSDLRAYIGGIEAIGQAGQELSASFASGNVHDAVVTAARKLFDATAVWVFLYNESTGMLECAVWYSENGGRGPVRELSINEGVAGRVFKTGEIALVPDVSEVEGFGWRSAGAASEALVEIPLLEAHRPIGVLGVLAPGIERWQLGGREIGLLTAFGSEVSIALQNARLYENERLVAETLQQALLLMPDRVAGVTFAHAYHSGTGELKVGGDFYDVFELGDDRVGMLIGDVSGKGLPAAVLTSVVKDTVRAHADEPDKSPAQVVALTNQLVEKQSAPDMFVTLFLACLDIQDGTLVYCNAGHPTTALIRADGRLPERLGATSPIAGAFADTVFAECEARVGPGDMLLLYTDGLTEARRDGELFGEERLFARLAQSKATNPQELIDEVYREVLAFARGKLGDDLAILAIQMGEGPGPAGVPSSEGGAAAGEATLTEGTGAWVI